MKTEKSKVVLKMLADGENSGSHNGEGSNKSKDHGACRCSNRWQGSWCMGNGCEDTGKGVVDGVKDWRKPV